jgi:parallel beta-helix repeat protein
MIPRLIFWRIALAVVVSLSVWGVMQGQQGGSAPQITFIFFDAEIKADGTPASGLVGFKDPDGDVIKAVFDVVQATDFQPFSFDPQVKGIKEGAFEFTLATKVPQRVTLRLTLIDEAGNRSQPKDFSFEAVAPILQVTPTSLRFSEQVGRTPASQTIQITNAGRGGTISWTASADRPWITLMPARGVAPATVTVSVNPAGLAAGSYSGQITVEAPGIYGSPATVSVVLELRLESTPPRTHVSLSPQPNANGWHNSDVTVTLQAEDEPGGSGVKEICWQLSGATQSAFRCQGGGSVAFTIGSEGTTIVEYQARDNVGNEEPKQRLEVRLDKTPPTGSLTINDGAASTTSTTVTLRITANDNLSGVAEMRFSNDGRTWSDWEDFQSTRSWDLTRFGGSSSGGPKTVYAQLRDRAGNESQPFSSQITVSLYTVCASGCLYSSVAQAIQQARNGDVITVGPGTYSENIVITKSLTLRGQSKDAVRLVGQERGRPVIRIESDHEMIEVTVQGLTITGARFREDGSCAELSSNPFRYLCPGGIEIFGQVRAFISDNNISNNADDGIDVFLGAYAEIKNNLINQNGYVGIQVNRQARAKIADNEINRNGEMGILVFRSSEAEITGNRITNTLLNPNNINDGIEVLDDSKATIRGNTITGNARHGIFIGGGYLYSDPSRQFRGSSAVIEDNIISNNKSNGIQVLASSASINRNTIQNNEGCGILAGDNPTITGSRNAISGNSGGNLCPPPGQFPWPPGFGGGA